MKQKRFLKSLFEARPAHLKQAEWRDLARNLIEQPNPKRPWFQDSDTGEWKRGSR